MLRSMFTAISSLNLHQKFLDVVSDNLANANTTGYKSSRVLFQSQFAQLLSPGAAPSATAGGVNPIEIGLGVKAGTITPTFTQGVLQSTGRNFDVSINGDGFFIYDHGTERTFSRDGAMDLDAAGYLVNSGTGARVQGWTAAGGVVDTNAQIGELQISRTGTMARATSIASLGGNLDAGSLPADVVTSTMSAYDALGTPLSATVEFTRTAAGSNTWNWNVTGPAGATGGGTIVFDTTTGQFASMTGANTVNIPTTSGAASPQNIANLDLSKVTMLSGDNSLSEIRQDGLPAGSVSDVYIAPNTGEIYLYYTNGLKELVGQLATARFANPSGLLRESNNMFREGANTGEPEIGAAGTGGRGSINAGYLEASNVDMAQEFTNMILAQRGFQASSRVITTSDEILQELVNLKR